METWAFSICVCVSTHITTQSNHPFCCYPSELLPKNDIEVQYRRTAMVLQEMRLWCRNSEQHKPLDVTNREMCGRHTMVWLMKWRLCAFGTRKEIVSMRPTICDSSEGRICFGLVWGVCTERKYFSAGRIFFDIATPSIKLHNNILSLIKSRSDPGIPTHQLHLVPRLQPLYVPSLPRHLLYL